ncbi:hypothetical protein GCM10027080_15970 [Pedococcus soli]
MAPTDALAPEPTAGSLRGNRTEGSAPARGTGPSAVTGFGALTGVDVDDGVCRVVALRTGVEVVRLAVVVLLVVVAAVLADVVGADVVGADVVGTAVEVGVVARTAPEALGDGSFPHPAVSATVRARDSARKDTAYRRGELIGAPLCPFRPARTSTVRPAAAGRTVVSRWACGQPSLQGRATVGTSDLGRAGSGGTSASGVSAV